MSLCPDLCLLAYHSTFNTLIMDLPLSSFVSHFFLPTCQFMVAVCDDFPIVTFVNENRPYFRGDRIDCRVLLLYSSSFVTLFNGLNIMNCG